MSDVGSWEPDAPELSDVHRKILGVAIKALDQPQLGESEPVGPEQCFFFVQIIIYVDFF